jgi:PEP-CTERM motif
MKHLQKLHCGGRLMLAASAVLLSAASTSIAGPAILTIDGRDVANLASEGNHATFHNPPVAFAFTFGGVAADNPAAGPGDPPGPTETDFNYTGTDFGGLGFGIQPDLAFDASLAYAQIRLTVNPGNTLQNLVLNLKDRDPIFVPPFSNIEEHQYFLGLGAPGTKTLIVPLATPGFTNNPTPGLPNGPGSSPDFLPLLGLSEVQLQYAFGEGGTGHVMDLTIHSIQLRLVPEPATLGLASLAAMGLAAVGCRRRRT